MGEEYNESVDASSDMDVSDVDVSDVDVADDVSVDIPDDIPEDVPEDASFDMDMTDDVTEDVSDDEFGNSGDCDEIDDLVDEDTIEPSDEELDDVQDDISEDTYESSDETSDEENGIDDIPEDNDERNLDFDDGISDVDDSNIPEDAIDADTEDEISEVENGDIAEQPLDVADNESTDEISDVEDADTDEQPQDIADAGTTDKTSDVEDTDTAEQLENAVDTETVDETFDVEGTGVTESTEGICKENSGNDVLPPSGTSDDPSKILKRDEFDLLKSGNDAINQRLEAQADDYRDKGLSEEEITERLAADRWKFQKEFLDDAFPGQDASPNVFNGFNENGSKDRLDEMDSSPLLRETLIDNGGKIAPDTNYVVDSGIPDESDASLLSKLLKNDTLTDAQGDGQYSRIRDIVGEDEYKKYQGFYDGLEKMGVSQEYREKLTDCYRKLDSDIKDVYNGLSDKLKCLDTNHQGTAYFSPDEGGFRFNESADVSKGLGEGNTFFHESAHMIDWLAGKGGSNATQINSLTDAAQADYNDAISRIMERENCTTEKAQSILSDELWSSPNESNCVSDIFGGISGNKVSGAWGHSSQYWAARDRSIIGKEAFAEITADSACNNSNLAFTQKYMPRTFNAYRAIIKSIKGGIQV